MAAIRRAKNAALGVRAVRMSHGGDEKTVRVFRVNYDRRNLLRIPQSKMCPVFSGISGFVNSITGGQVRPLQTFSAANINHIRIGKSHSKRPHRTGRLIVKDRVPSVPKIRGFPDAAVHRGDIKDVRLMRHAGNSYGAPAAKRSDATPAHLAEKLWIEVRTTLRVGTRQRFFVGVAGKRRSRHDPAKHNPNCNSTREPGCRHTTLKQTKHPTPPRNRRGYS